MTIEIALAFVNVIVAVLMTVATFFLRRLVSQFDEVVRTQNEHSKLLASIQTRHDLYNGEKK
jgi:hypothetical protein